MPKIHLYTVPGQVYYTATRKLVLRGADGVVFVADSQANRVRQNVESWLDMKSYLDELGLVDIPVVVQFNKRDLAEAVPIAAMKRAMNLSDDYPVFEVTAAQGEGVFDTLQAVVSQVMMRIDRQFSAATM
jgi:signal recognition particle receptor subunit beta